MKNRPVKLRAPATGDYTGGLFAFVLAAAFVVGALYAFV